MTTDNEREITPPASFYEKPYLPGAGDRDEFETIPLLAVEAHSILIERSGRPMSAVDRLALQRILDADGDERIDFLATRRRILAELELDEDWD